MARMNRNIAVWLINLLDIKPNDTVLEIGFGPGIAIGQIADLVTWATDLRHRLSAGNGAASDGSE